MLATILGDTQNMLNMQYITPHLKRWDYSDIGLFRHGGGHKKIKEPTHAVEGGHHLRKAPTPTHLMACVTRIILLTKIGWLGYFHTEAELQINNSTVCHCNLNHQQLNYLFNTLFRLTRKKLSKHCIIGPPWKPIIWKAFPCHDATIIFSETGLRLPFLRG